MPFDSAPERSGRDKLARLSRLLRKPLPFAWNFDDFQSCALGLAAHHGLVRPLHNAHDWLDDFAKDLGLGQPDFHRLFVEARDSRFFCTTPRYVANRIDKYLAETA